MLDVPRVVRAFRFNLNWSFQFDDMTEKRTSKKKYRALKKADEISSVFDLKRRISQGHFALHYRENLLSVTRCAIMVSKKISRRAIGRNYMRRVAKQFIRDKQNELSGWDVIIRIVKPFNRKEYSAVKIELEKLLQQIKYEKPAAFNT